MTCPLCDPNPPAWDGRLFIGDDDVAIMLGILRAFPGITIQQIEAVKYALWLKGCQVRQEVWREMVTKELADYAGVEGVAI